MMNDAFIKRFTVYCCAPKVLHNHVCVCVGGGGGGVLVHCELTQTNNEQLYFY